MRSKLLPVGVCQTETGRIEGTFQGEHTGGLEVVEDADPGQDVATERN